MIVTGAPLSERGAAAIESRQSRGLRRALNQTNDTKNNRHFSNSRDTEV